MLKNKYGERLDIVDFNFKCKIKNERGKSEK